MIQGRFMNIDLKILYCGEEAHVSNAPWANTDNVYPVFQMCEPTCRPFMFQNRSDALTRVAIDR